MLYVTTRNPKDAYTAYKALTEDRAPDGGFYLPLRFPQYSWQELRELGRLGVYECICRVLNPLCNGHLMATDLEFRLGRKTVRARPLNKKTLFVQLWHNPKGDFSYFCKGLSDLLLEDRSVSVPSNWTRIACRMALLFAAVTPLIYGNVLQEGDAVDVSVIGEDFSAPMAVWYTRAMGLPVGQIISCDPAHTLWSFLHYGSHRTEGELPSDLERLIHGCGGSGEVKRYLSQPSYTPHEMILDRLRHDLQIAVVSEARSQEAISRVYRSHGYLMGLSSAMAYSGLLDCRSSCTTGKLGMVMEDRGCEPEIIAKAFGISLKEAEKLIDSV